MKINSHSKWYCHNCGNEYDLTIEIPENKKDPFVYLYDLHIHAMGNIVHLPRVPVKICFNDRLQISDHADEVSNELKEDY